MGFSVHVFVREKKSQTVVKTFPYVFKGWMCMSSKNENLSPVMVKEILWSLCSDWLARVVYPIHILLIFGGRCNRYFWDTVQRRKIYRLANFICSFSSCQQNFPKVNCFVFPEADRVINIVAKGLFPSLQLYNYFRYLMVLESSKSRWLYSGCCPPVLQN